MPVLTSTIIELNAEKQQPLFEVGSLIIMPFVVPSQRLSFERAKGEYKILIKVALWFACCSMLRQYGCISEVLVMNKGIHDRRVHCYFLNSLHLYAM